MLSTNLTQTISLTLQSLSILQKSTKNSNHMEQKHFIFVHGCSHGAWCWFKLKPLLEGAGHRVTVLDMAASGINMKAMKDVRSLQEYSEPLLEKMASLKTNEKAILVGHSFGGLSLALAMEKYPEKIALSVFLTAFLPDTSHKPSFILDKYFENIPLDFWLDTQFSTFGNSKEASILFGPSFIASKVYQLSPVEDLELGKSLVRLGSLFMDDLSKAEKFSKEKFGSVPKLYVICNEDKTITKSYQEWMIENCGIENVMEIDGADHMPMFSKPRQLFDCLVRVAHTLM